MYNKSKEEKIRQVKQIFIYFYIFYFILIYYQKDKILKFLEFFNLPKLT